MSGEEQVPIIELMRQCWLHGIDTEYEILSDIAVEALGTGTPAEGVWEQWWKDYGKALMHSFYGGASEAAAEEEYAEVLERIDTNVQVMMQALLDAGAEIDPPIGPDIVP